MRYDLNNNISSPITTDIKNVVDIDADRNDGLVFFTTLPDLQIYRTNYMAHGEIIVIKNAKGKLWPIIIVNI